MSYGLIVIGGGPAGCQAAKRAAQEGIKTLLVEKKLLGGVCLNEGCIPLKVFLHSSKIFESIKSGEKIGVTAKEIEISHEDVVERKHQVVNKLHKGLQNDLKGNVEIVYGSAKIIGKCEELYEVKVNGSSFYTKKLLIATGSVPIIPQINGIEEGLKSGYVKTTDIIFDLNEIPDSMIIIGGGAVGTELASYFSVIGCKVTIIEKLDRIIPGADKKVSGVLTRALRKNGVEILTNTEVLKILSDRVNVSLGSSNADIFAGSILLCAGRNPCTQGLGLDNVNVETINEAVKTDLFCQTSNPDIYAAGDVNGKSLLAHTGYREADVCINNIIGKQDKINYNSIPHVISSNPEVAYVGETEDTVNSKGIPYNVITLPMQLSGRFLIENTDSYGEFFKVIVNKENNKVLGACIIGSYASEIIYGLGLMIEKDVTVDELKSTVFPHPTVSEIVREGLFSIKL